MLSFAKMAGGGGQIAYYLELASEEYFLKGGEPLGKWISFTDHCQLTGNVQNDQLRALGKGKHPTTGKDLVQQQRWNDRERVPGWDATFSAPKSISLIWAAADAETRQAIQDALYEAAKEALTYLNNTAAFSRVGKGGQELQKCDFVAALFEHSTNRELEANLHLHCLIMNAGFGEDKSRALYSQPLYAHKMATGAIFRASFAHKLQSDPRLGLALERDRQFFRSPLVSKQTEEHYSTRSKQIKQQQQKVGDFSQKGADEASLETRRAKRHILRSDLFKQLQEDPNFELTPELVKENLGQANVLSERDQRLEAINACEQALFRLDNETILFSKAKFVQYAAEEAQTTGLSPQYLLPEVEKTLATHSEIIKPTQDLFTTRANLELEQSIDKLAADSLNNASHQLSDEAVAYGIDQAQKELRRRFDDPSIELSHEQVLAIKHITQNMGSIQNLQGYAGSGKTTLLRAAKAAWEYEGYTVLGAALGAKAARTLEAETGIKSRTLHSLQIQLERDAPSKKVAHHAKELVKEALRSFGLNPDADKPEKVKEAITSVVFEALKLFGITPEKQKLSEAALEAAGLNPKARRPATAKELASNLAGQATKEALRSVGLPISLNAKAPDTEGFTLKEKVNFHAKQLVRQALWQAGIRQGQRTPKWEKQPLKFDEKTILIIDEAGTVGSTQHHYFINKTRTKEDGGVGCKLVNAGDTVQLPSIEKGSPFAQLIRTLGCVELTENRRQQKDWEKEALIKIRRGETEEALKLYAEHDRIQIGKDLAHANQLLIDAWEKRRTADLSGTTILAATNAEVGELNKLAQERRLAAGELNESQSAQLPSGEIAFVGDRVAFTTENRYALGLYNGDMGTLTKVKGEGINTTLTVAIDSPEKTKYVSFMLDEYEHLRLGYAGTTYSNQGATLDRVFMLGNPSFQHKHDSYVQLSRARESVDIFLSKHQAGNDLAAFARAMKREKESQIIAEHQQQEEQRKQQQSQALTRI